MTVQDLRPNSQDTSAFYLGNIYRVLVDSNVTLASVPTPVAEPPPFSRPRYAVWVNSLWFLSLVMSVSCALWATSLHQWARRYIRLTQPARCSPEKRARMRAFFANGVDEMHVPWAVEGLPTLLHLSLFLFFGGLAIFLFNVDQEVFTCVVSWIGLFSALYGLVTLLPSIRHDSPYNTPLSIPAWFLYSRMQYLALKCQVLIHYRGGYQRYQMERRLESWKLEGVEKKAEESAEELSSEIDVRILGWTISALGDDDSLEKFFEAIPGFFNSKLVKDLERNLSVSLLKTFCGALDGFMRRTLSSNSVAETVKSRRNIICRDIAGIMPCPDHHMLDRLFSYFDEAPVSIDSLQALARWFPHSSSDVSDIARTLVICRLPKLQERDYRWIGLASNACGFVCHDIALSRDNMVLSALIDVSRRAIHANIYGVMNLVVALMDESTEFDIRYTFPRLRRDFCTLWNETVQEAKKQGSYSTPVEILCLIRHLYITLHRGTDAAPTAFSASTPNRDDVLFQPSSYPLCDIARHYPGPTAYDPDNFFAISHLTRPAATEPAIPVQTSAYYPHLTDASPPSAMRDIPLARILSFPLEGTTLQDIVSPCAEPDTSEIPSTPEQDPEFRSRAMNESSKSATSISHPLLSASASSVVGFSVPASPPFLNAESLAIPDGTTLFRPTGNDGLPQLRAGGIVNTASMCFANAVSQVLVRSPPLWDMFRDLKGQRGAGSSVIGGGATPLVDATVRSFEEIMNKEKPPPTRQSSRQAADGKMREDEEAKKEPNTVDSFEPTYIYDAMKEKPQLKSLLVRSRAMCDFAVTDLCWPYVYRMANSRMRKSFSASTLTRLMKNCSRYSVLLVVATRLLLRPE